MKNGEKGGRERTIGIQLQVIKKVVCIGLSQAGLVHVQSHECNPGPKRNPQVQLLDKRLQTQYVSSVLRASLVSTYSLLAPRPSKHWVKPVKILILGMRLEVRGLLRVVKDTGLSSNVIGVLFLGTPIKQAEQGSLSRLTLGPVERDDGRSLLGVDVFFLVSWICHDGCCRG